MEHGIINGIHTKYSWMDRIRILLGKESHTHTNIETDKDVNILESKSITYVDRVFPRKEISMKAEFKCPACKTELINDLCPEEFCSRHNG